MAVLIYNICCYKKGIIIQRNIEHSIRTLLFFKLKHLALLFTMVKKSPPLCASRRHQKLAQQDGDIWKISRYDSLLVFKKRDRETEKCASEL